MDKQKQSSGYGYMIVRVSTARGAIPLEDATVIIFNYLPEEFDRSGDVVAVDTTNNSGITRKFSLPAPSNSLSLTPGNGKTYSTYNISVFKDGYRPQTYVNVPVFEGITAIQNADLIPLSENGQTDREDLNSEIIYEGENPFLEG